MLAFDALVLWKASGQMPTKGMIIHGLQHTILGLRLDTLIHEVQLLVGKLRALLSESSPPEPVLILSGHPKPANEGHLKTGQR